MKVADKTESSSQPTSSHPDTLAIASFFVRSKGLQTKRIISNSFNPLPRLDTGSIAEFPYVVAESTSPLRTSIDPRERPLLLGKIQNLRIACRRINRLALSRGQIFSFWRQVGPPWQIFGYEVGREVREGCVIPTRGGGLCQLSGSLFEVATAIGCDLVERHRHTALPADVPQNAQRDATLFWNYVDLSFRSPIPIIFEAYLTEQSLVVKLRTNKPIAENSGPLVIARHVNLEARESPTTIGASCFTCNQASCERHPVRSGLIKLKNENKTAFLLDEVQPEFRTYVCNHARNGDQVLSRSRLRHDENGALFRRQLFRLQRSWKLRSTVARGMTLAKAHFELGETLAKNFGNRISFDVEHLCVSQNLLPHIWRSGALGGRTFDVLMYRLPVSLLEKELDKAAQLYPESKTLTEFRAPRWFADAEAEALASAQSVVTPHPQIARLFPNANRLNWQVHDESPSDAFSKKKDLIVFFGPTLARKGAYAVREAVKRMGFKLTVVGSDLEGDGFWRDLPVTREAATSLDWSRVHTVLQPALFEFWPRHSLRARALGSHLVVSSFSGLEENKTEGVCHVPFGDADALVATMEQILAAPKID